MMDFENKLKTFQVDNNIFSKGKLSVVIQFTRLVQGKEFPLDSNDFKTEKEGQVAGLGGSNLKKILKHHGITQQLSAEGGRTSRGSMGLMIKYVDFLNTWNAEEPVGPWRHHYFLHVYRVFLHRSDQSGDGIHR